MSRHKVHSNARPPQSSLARIRYIHPVDLLRDRLFDANCCASVLIEVSVDNYELTYYVTDSGVRLDSSKLRPDGYCNDIRKRHVAPAMRALERALPAAISIGQWLRWGMPERAGAFETELRMALQWLRSWVFHFPGVAIFPSLKDRRLEWVAKLDKVGDMSADLEHVAIESRDPGEWNQALRDALAAANIVGRSLNVLYIAAEVASPDLAPHEKAARVAIVSLRDVLARIGPRLVYLLDDDDYAEGLTEHLPDWLFERVDQLCRWGEQRPDPEKLDLAIRERPPGTLVAKHLGAFESGISYLLDPPRAQDMLQGSPLPRKRRQRVGKADQKAFEQAREDSIAEIIRSIAREGGIVTSGVVASRSERQDGKSIPEGTIRNSKSWRNREEIASEARGNTSYLDMYRGVDAFTGDERPFDEQESES